MREELEWIWELFSLLHRSESYSGTCPLWQIYQAEGLMPWHFGLSDQHEKSTERYFYTCLGIIWLNSIIGQEKHFVLLFIQNTMQSQLKFMVSIVFIILFRFFLFFFFRQCLALYPVCLYVLLVFPLAERWNLLPKAENYPRLSLRHSLPQKGENQFPALSLWTEKPHLGHVCWVNN